MKEFNLTGSVQLRPLPVLTLRLPRQYHLKRVDSHQRGHSLLPCSLISLPMASKAKAKRKEKESASEPPVTAQVKSAAAPATIEYCARFVHGSPDSRDLDVVYVVAPESQFPNQTTLVSFCKGHEEDRNVIQLARENGTTGDWFVSRSFRGAPDEVNNAVLETHRNVPGDAPSKFDVTNKCCRSVLLRYIVATKAIIIKMRHLESCRKECVNALQTWHFSTNVSTVHAACRNSFEYLDQESAKYVTFHLAQSYALAIGVELFTKRNLVAFLNEIEPILYYQGASDAIVPKQHLNIMRDLETRWHALTARIVAKPFESEKYVQSFHLAGPLVAYNYLEANCVASVIDMQSERIVALGVMVPFATPDSSSHPDGSGSPSAIQYPPTWPFDNATVEGEESGASEVRWLTMGSLGGRLVVCEHAPSTTSAQRNASKSTNAKGKASGRSDAAHAPQCGASWANAAKVTRLVNSLSDASAAPYLETINFTVRMRGDEVEEISARSRLSLRRVKVPSELDRC